MTKKFSWEAEKTSLILRVTDGAKETTWKIRKATHNESLRTIFEEIQLAMWVPTHRLHEEYDVKGSDLEAQEKAWEESSSVSTDALTEEGSKEALNARVGQLSANAQWWNSDDDIDEEIMFEKVSALPDYDEGEIK